MLTFAFIFLFSAFTVFTVTYAADIDAELFSTASEIKAANTWSKYGSLTLSDNREYVRFVPTMDLSNGYGITVDIPTEDAKYLVVKYDTNLFKNSFGIAYSMKSNFDFNYQYGVARTSNSVNKKVMVFNMTSAATEAEKEGTSSIKYLKILPWNGGSISYDGNLSDCYFDVYSIAVFADVSEANAYAKELQSESFVDYDALPKADAFYLAEDLNNNYIWAKSGYRAEILGAVDNPFKYVPTSNASNGIGFNVDVPTDKAKYVVVRYHTNVAEQRLSVAYSHDSGFDFNKQYGVTSVSNVADKRVELFDMSSLVSAAKQSGVTNIEYLKIMPWGGQTWTGNETLSSNYFNLYSVAFFENISDAEAYKAALEAALPPLEFDKLYDNNGITILPGIKADTTVIDNMIAAFKEKEKDFANKENKLIIYPEYPDRIGRDYDYSVKVSQGGEAYSIPVYNELRQRGATRNYYGDNHRRFCEFAFQGEPVRIDITVNMSFSEYTIIPAAKNIPSTVNGNVISVYVSEPMQLILRLGNGLESNNTNLAIFVDPPEENIPDKNDPKVIYIEGWYEEEDNELNITESGTTVYIAPGSVCNARILSKGNSDVTITGRGMVRDPQDTRTLNVHGTNYNVNITSGKNIRVDGIKIVDCRFYHLYLASVNTAEVYNFKIFSNQISTDGFVIPSSKNIYMHDSYADVGDDVFTGEGTNKYYEDMLVGSTCGVFSLSGQRNNETYKDIHIFRADEAIFKNFYGSGVFFGATFENVFAVDCPFTPFFIGSRSQGDGMKNFVFKNVSINSPSGNGEKNIPTNNYTGTVISIANGNPFQFDFENMYIDGELITSNSQINRTDASNSGAIINVTFDADSQSHIPLTTNTTVLATPYVAPKKELKPLNNGENIIPNGSFENGAAPWVTIDFSTIELTDDANSGDFAMYVPATSVVGGISRQVTDEINRGGAGEYLVEFYAKKAPDSTGSDVVATLKYYYGEITATTAMNSDAPSMTVTLTD